MEGADFIHHLITIAAVGMCEYPGVFRIAKMRILSTEKKEQVIRVC